MSTVVRTDLAATPDVISVTEEVVYMSPGPRKSQQDL